MHHSNEWFTSFLGLQCYLVKSSSHSRPSFSNDSHCLVVLENEFKALQANLSQDAQIELDCFRANMVISNLDSLEGMASLHISSSTFKVI